MECTNCGSDNVQNEAEEGIRVCLDCNTVFKHTHLVVEVGFQDTGDGGSAVIGQYVSGEAPSTSKGATRIRELAQTMNLRPSFTDSALRLYKVAKDKNFTNGRKVDHVAVSCLYLVCRRTESPHMLLDFSDAVQITVQLLGHTFLQFCKTLSLEPPLVDPSFAAQLEFGDKEALVAQTALRLIQRMKRDWIIQGRRPAGVVGAALLLAGRMHGFKRTSDDIVHIVRVSDTTLKKRVAEFIATPAADIVLEEFEKKDPTQGANDVDEEWATGTFPPSYTAAIKRQVKKEKELSSGSSDSESEKKSKKKKKKKKSSGEDGDEGESKKKKKKRKRKEKDSDGEKKKKKGKKSKDDSERPKKRKKTTKDNEKGEKDESDETNEKEQKKKSKKTKKRKKARDTRDDPQIVGGSTLENIKEILDTTALDPESLPHDEVAAEMDQCLQQFNRELNGTEEPPSTNQEEEAPKEHVDEDGNATFSDIEDDEINCYLIPESDIRARKVVWFLTNPGYHKAQLEKEAKAKEAAAKPKKKRGRASAASTRKAPSQKINYEAVKLMEELENDPFGDNEDMYGEGDDLLDNEEFDDEM